MKKTFPILAFFLSLLAAGVATADPPPGKGKSGSPQPLAMFDANGVFMGDLASLDRDQFSFPPDIYARIVYRVDTNSAVYFETHPLVLLTLEKERGFIGHVAFSGANCSERPYVSSNLVGPTPFFGLPEVPVIETNSGPILFVPVDPSGPIISAEIQSEWNVSFDPECFDYGQASEVSDLVEAVDIPLEFERPYKIGY